MATAADRVIGTGARMGLAVRAIVLALVLACEKVPLDFLVNVDAAQHTGGFGTLVLTAQHVVFRFVVALALSLLVFAFAKGDRAGWSGLSDSVLGMPVRMSWIGVHIIAWLPLLPLSFFLYGHANAPLPFAMRVALWILFAAIAVGSLIQALAPWKAWWAAARRLGALWLYAALVAAVATSAIRLTQQLWGPTAAVTFRVVQRVLQPLIPGLQANPTTQILSSSRFAVQVTEYCSGLEGAGLMLAFCSAWLLCFREDYRFPRALLLLPAGVALSLVLNVFRIAILMLIGDRGYPDVAQFGFHSQAGWIAFICSAGLLATLSRRSRWFANLAASPALAAELPDAKGTALVSVPRSGAQTREGNPTASYLLPLLAFLAAGMIARAFSVGVEMLYVLAPAAALVALTRSRRELRVLDWRFGWRGVMAGVASAAVWAAAAQLLGHPQSMPAGLTALPEPARIYWLGLRFAAAVTVIPVAEELAFRGYLLRRITTVEFDRLPFQAAGLTALFVSSLLFGIEYGSLWVPATLAGLIYGRLLMQTGRMGDAVIAHGTAAALISVDVLLRGYWQLW